jgi:tetratricopeptide (TPR) repeat protein
MRNLLLALTLLSVACAAAPAGPPSQPNEREWALLNADYQWIQTLRNAQKQPMPSMPRKEQIELALDNLKKLEVPYNAFVAKMEEYIKRTGDPRGIRILAIEKILLGDQYMNVLSRYDAAIEMYRAALEIEPANVDAQERIRLAEERRYVNMAAFAKVKQGMKEQDVQTIVGLPREDWIKQVVQKNRVYSVWIYPKADGGASAIYFDNGVVYHTNWNAAVAPAR